MDILPQPNCSSCCTILILNNFKLAIYTGASFMNRIQNITCKVHELQVHTMFYKVCLLSSQVYYSVRICPEQHLTMVRLQIVLHKNVQVWQKKIYSIYPAHTATNQSAIKNKSNYLKNKTKQRRNVENKLNSIQNSNDSVSLQFLSKQYIPRYHNVFPVGKNWIALIYCNV